MEEKEPTIMFTGIDIDRCTSYVILDNAKRLDMDLAMTIELHQKLTEYLSLMIRIAAKKEKESKQCV